MLEPWIEIFTIYRVVTRLLAQLRTVSRVVVAEFSPCATLIYGEMYMELIGTIIDGNKV